MQNRQINVGRVAAARDASSVRISWATLFMRSLFIVAQRWPVLRQCYMRWPWSHVYQTTTSIGMIAVQREFRGQPWTFFGRLQQPHSDSLLSIQAKHDQFASEPVEQAFRVQYHQSAMPLILRRARIWLALHVFPRRRVRHFGTFALTTVGSRGSEISMPPLFNSASFSYGPIDALGNCRLTVAYDHRLIDGAPIAELLADVETTLNGEVLAELFATSPAPGRFAPGEAV